jgi:hypothetical protein
LCKLYRIIYTLSCAETLHDDKKRIVAFKAKTSNDDGESDGSTNDDVALMFKRFKKLMKKKGYQGGYSKNENSYSKNSFTKKKCFKCGEMDHISMNCKKKDEENSSKNKKFEGKKKLKTYNKKKNVKTFYV